MSAYIAYKATVGVPESRRTVVSNIHRKERSRLRQVPISLILLRRFWIKASGTDRGSKQRGMPNERRFFKSKGTFAARVIPNVSPELCKTAVST